MVTHLIGFGIGVTLAFGGNHMNQHRPFTPVGRLEGANHLAHVMAINGPHVSEAQFFKHSPHLGHRQALHPFLKAGQF